MVADELRVLVIEDNPQDTRLLELMLATPRPGVQTRVVLDEAGTLGDGLARLHESRADAVLLDLNLPDSTGLDTVRTLIAASPDTPVVVMTGLNDPELGRRAIMAGAQDYMIKGEVDERLLVRVIRHAIERHRLSHALPTSGPHWFAAWTTAPRN